MLEIYSIAVSLCVSLIFVAAIFGTQPGYTANTGQKCTFFEFVKNKMNAIEIQPKYSDMLLEFKRRYFNSHVSFLARDNLSRRGLESIL